MAAHTKIDLYQMQSLPLDAKIRMTARRIDAFIDRNDAYLSISGGKDSRVLDDIERRFVRAKLPRVFIDTGLEHRSVRACGKKHADIILRPEKNFKQIITEYGYPVISKERTGSMTKKKPDFLRDLDTAIMDELTGGGIKGNVAGLVGTLTQIKEIKQLCGLPFCGYMAKLETVRPSGVPDEVTVVFAEDVPYKACNGIEFDVMQEFVEGSRLLMTGKAQTLKDFQSGRLLVYILADFVAVSEKAVEQDEVAVRGIIANKPTHRETPRGKHITDITVKVKNEITGGSCYLPCICWQEQADEAAQWQQGDTVELLGRYQSRQYEKVLDTATGEREQRTAYEVSVRLIRRKEETENEE